MPRLTARCFFLATGNTFLNRMPVAAVVPNKRLGGTESGRCRLARRGESHVGRHCGVRPVCRKLGFDCLPTGRPEPTMNVILGFLALGATPAKRPPLL